MNKLTFIISSFGVAAITFICSIALVGWDTQESYGFYAFAIVIQSFFNGASNALIASPMLVQLNTTQDRERVLISYSWAAFLFSCLFGLIQSITAYAFLSSTDIFYVSFFWGALAGFRWCLRIISNNIQVNSEVVFSDFIYVIFSLSFLIVIYFFFSVDLYSVALSQTAAMLLSIFPFKNRFYLFRSFFRVCHLKILNKGFREVGKHSFLGVASSEVITNVHSYAVVFFYGLSAYAPLAIIMLLFRPINIILLSLTQLEKPRFAQYIAENKAFKLNRELILFFNLSIFFFLINFIIVFFVEKHFYDFFWKVQTDRDVVIFSLYIYSVGLLFKSIRVPVSVYFQASNEYVFLSKAGVYSAFLALAVMPLSMVFLDVKFSFLAILSGELLLLVLLSQKYKREFIYGTN